MQITYPPIMTRHRSGLPTSLNRRRKWWTPWHTAATALAVASVAGLTIALIKLNQN